MVCDVMLDWSSLLPVLNAGVFHASRRIREARDLLVLPVQVCALAEGPLQATGSMRPTRPWSIALQPEHAEVMDGARASGLDLVDTASCPGQHFLRQLQPQDLLLHEAIAACRLLCLRVCLRSALDVGPFVARERERERNNSGVRKYCNL